MKTLFYANKRLRSVKYRSQDERGRRKNTKPRLEGVGGNFRTRKKKESASEKRGSEEFKKGLCNEIQHSSSFVLSSYRSTFSRSHHAMTKLGADFGC